MAIKHLCFHLGSHLPLILNPPVQRDLLPHVSRTQLSTSVGPSDKAIEVLNNNNKFFWRFFVAQFHTSPQHNLDTYKNVPLHIPSTAAVRYQDMINTTENYSEQVFRENYFPASVKHSYRNLNALMMRTVALQISGARKGKATEES